MAISATPVHPRLVWSSRRDTKASELWKITGSTGAVGDTVAITTRMRGPEICVSGAFSYTVSGRVITLTAKVQIDNADVVVEIVGIP